MNSTLYNSRPFGIISPRKQMEYSENSIDVRYERKLLVFINWLDFLDKLPDAEVFVSIKVDDIIESLDLRKLRSETEKRTDLVFNLWSSDKPPNSFSNSFKGIEIFLVSMKDLVFKKLADGFLCAQFLINDSRRHMVCLPLLKGKSYQKSNHNFTEVEKFVGDSLCAVCGNFVLIKNKCRVCSCGLFVHAECLKNKAIKLPCRTNVGKVLLTYCCVEDFVVPLPNYKSFIKCCLEQKYFDAIVAIVHSLNTDERSEVLRTYLEVLEACSLDNTSYAVQFLKQVTSQEIINASSLSTLFRGNS
ncbi:uncharacterized protein LOC135121296, partial [Zophobas morio]|uniref:uncharacterized protein LOC135121296 n=1 Tax=Zophobas morio TaxID=2755281 RepID=UPI0030837E49